MNTADLEAFIAVVETGSIVGASARLHITQPGISRRVQSLEELLDVALLDRQSKPLKPTAAGREAYAHARRVVQAVADLKTGALGDGCIGGELRIGITPYLSEVALIQPLDQLRGSFPSLVLNITQGWPEQLVDQVRRSEVDMAAFNLPDGAQPSEELSATDLGVQSVILVAARNAEVSSSASLRDLSRMPWIINKDGCGFRSAIVRRLEAEHLPLQVGIEALSSELRLSLVARGLGIGMATPMSLAGSQWRDGLKVIHTPGFDLRVRAWAVHRPPAGRLQRPMECFKGALAVALQEVD